METLHIIGLVAIVLIPLLFLVFRPSDPALVAKRRLDKLVRSIPNAQAFYAAMAQKGRVSLSSQVTEPSLPTRRGGGHFCEYCGNQLYITDTGCNGCGAPRG